MQVYPAQTVDGLVHAFGGKDLALACERIAEVEPGVRCVTGAAVCTPASARLAEQFQKIVHAVPPFYSQYTEAEADALLLSAYRSAFHAVWGRQSADAGRRFFQGWWTQDARPWACATPLLGAGARSAPVEAAVCVAAFAAAEWIQECAPSGHAHVAPGAVLFGIPEQCVAEQLAAALDQALDVDKNGFDIDSNRFPSKRVP